MLFHAEDHPANSPETWQVVKAGPTSWQLRTKDGGLLETARTKRAAEALKVEGHLVELYLDEGRWFAGEQVRNWKPYEPARPSSTEAAQLAAVKIHPQVTAYLSQAQERTRRLHNERVLAAEAAFAAIHPDQRAVIDGRPYVLKFVDGVGTCLVPFEV